MKRLVLVCALGLAAVGLAAMAAPASAAVVFNVNGVFGGPGGTLTGTFTTNDALTQITGIDLISSSNGGFQGFEYNDLSKVDSQLSPNSFRLTVSLPGSHTDQLQLAFIPALTASGGTIGGNSFEHQDFQGSGNRSLTGTVTQAVAGATAAVPEPAAWLLMIGGFGMAGATLRARRRMLNAA